MTPVKKRKNEKKENKSLLPVNPKQFLVLWSIARTKGGISSCFEIRQEMKEWNEADKHPAFYMYLCKMRDDGFIERTTSEGEYEWIEDKTGRRVRHTMYVLTKKGTKSYNNALAFYRGKKAV